MKKRLLVMMAVFTFVFGAAGITFAAGNNGGGGVTTQELPTIF
ncbi:MULTISPECIES: hypothetical protein [Bacillales]|jgi:hypothetical protein|uniref:Uncharacterized protein n=1 Tax=Cytobacillus pseudoceanisediminis TaxID=3051614 RepID=A0ABZ2ZGI9_9BACI|nr:MULTISPECIES: hypothetical protein [Bacillales]MDA6082759.1 hypothetical protein [Escherichia coli]MDD9310188.1 hypothetical protein [Cytobacillus firmus]MDK7666845.1 hypothetical protein [Cytobacillus oceanisediminis]MEC1894310.1 hypothetical protein [Cytobacillus firmus]MED1904897.1 hypothetical protein [Cytobacillus firmus]